MATTCAIDVEFGVRVIHHKRNFSSIDGASEEALSLWSSVKTYSDAVALVYCTSSSRDCRDHARPSVAAVKSPLPLSSSKTMLARGRRAQTSTAP